VILYWTFLNVVLTLAFETLFYVFTTRRCHLFALILLAAAFHGRVCLLSILQSGTVTLGYVGGAGTPSWNQETGALGSPRFATPRCRLLGLGWNDIRIKHGLVVCMQLTSLSMGVSRTDQWYSL